MKTLLKFIWGVAKFLIAAYLFVFALHIAYHWGDDCWMAFIVAFVAMLFHWRFWILAIPAIIVGFMIGRRI